MIKLYIFFLTIFTPTLLNIPSQTLCESGFHFYLEVTWKSSPNYSAISSTYDFQKNYNLYPVSS